MRLHLSIGKCRAIRDLLAKLFNSSNKSKHASEVAVMRRPPHVGILYKLCSGFGQTQAFQQYKPLNNQSFDCDGGLVLIL